MVTQDYSTTSEQNAVTGNPASVLSNLWELSNKQNLSAYHVYQHYTVTTNSAVFYSLEPNSL